MYHHAIKQMRRERWRRIVNFSSDAFKGSVGQCNYSAANAGIIGLTRSIAKEYEDITLNCRDCNAEFVFTAGEQEFYNSKGWENQPTRCTECKNAKKARFGEGPAAKPVCYAWQRGECTRGDACRFSHEEGGGGDSRPPSRGAPICYAFQRGECDRGDSCRFSHDANAATPQKSSAPCYAFQRGECTRGDACRFSHDPNAEAPPRSSAPCYAFQRGECDRGDACRFSHEQ